MTRPGQGRLPRLLALLPWLRAHPGVRVDVAAAEFGVSETQLREDLNLLWFCGLPGQGPQDLIELEFEGDTITVLDPQTLDRPLRLTGDEALALVVAARALADVPGLVPDAALERALVKLQGAVGGVEGDAGGAPPAVSVELSAGTEDAAVVAAVRTAVEGRRRLRLRYLVERRDEVTDREVDPVALHLTEGRLYLQAWDPERDGSRLFRLDRVVAAEVLDAPATPPPGQVPRDLADGLFRPDPGDTRVELQLGPAARWVADYHPCEEVAETGDGGLRAVLRTPDTDWVVRLLLRLGGTARATAPAGLDQAVRAAAAAGLAAYDEVTGASGHAPAGATD